MPKEKLQILTAALWTIFGFGLSYSAYVKGNTGVAILGLILGSFWLYRLRIAIKNKTENTQS